MSVNEPLYNFARAFADQGTKNIIPDSNNEASGLASLINGFPAITQVKPEMGGIPPQRADFNGILYILSAFACGRSLVASTPIKTTCSTTLTVWFYTKTFSMSV